MAAKTVYIIGGPTASGKTGLAIALAKHFHTSIISADSRQCYKELTIGVAKPTEQELAAVPHSFINQFHLSEEVNARIFEEAAMGFVKKIFDKNPVAIMAGGTGLYIKAFCEGLDQVPEIDPVLRRQIRDNYAQHGLAWLREEVRIKDPAYWLKADQMNPQRLLRALEVKEQTGQSILIFHEQKKPARDFSIKKIGIDLPRERLYAQINHRVDTMMEEGLLEEAMRLLPYRHLPALRTVGYEELFAYFDGKYTLPQAVDKIRQHTRNYAKRQMTWFRRDTTFTWIKGNSLSEALSKLELKK